jgi:hypothetical protein
MAQHGSRWAWRAAGGTLSALTLLVGTAITGVAPAAAAPAGVDCGPSWLCGPGDEERGDQAGPQ